MDELFKVIGYAVVDILVEAVIDGDEQSPSGLFHCKGGVNVMEDFDFRFLGHVIVDILADVLEK